jgi:hypothetical protein
VSGLRGDVVAMPVLACIRVRWENPSTVKEERAMAKVWTGILMVAAVRGSRSSSRRSVPLTVGRTRTVSLLRPSKRNRTKYSKPL